MTVVGQHPGYEVPQRATGTSSTWFRMLLVLLAVALVAGVGYLAYESATDEPVAEPITFEAYPSHATVQSEIDAALLSVSGPTSVEMVRAEIEEALMWQRSGASSVDIVQAQILQARADLLASPSSVAIVQAEIDAALAEQARLASLTEVWDAQYVSGFVAPEPISLSTNASFGATEAWMRLAGPESLDTVASSGPAEAFDREVVTTEIVPAVPASDLTDWEREYVFGLMNEAR
ncbi:MAG: hypothetical protein QNJ71_08835 [Acidimicrobiia bacterium]|nr:hypothetical protein [Acidimicrobiia bacterium]